MASLSRKIPADISDEERAFVRETAVKAFKALGCNGRLPHRFYDGQRHPGNLDQRDQHHPRSLSFYLWEPMGVKYPELLDRMIALALKRQREEAEIHYDFDTKILEGASFGGTKGE